MKLLASICFAAASTLGAVPANAQLNATEEATLLPSDAGPGHQYGHGVAVDGDTAVVGSQHADGVAVDTGAAYVYVRSGVSWTEQAKLEASDGATGDTYGVHVALDGDTAVIGSRFDDDLGTDSGSVYVYVRSGTTWTLEDKLTASDGEASDAFGRRVAISGDTIVVGAANEDELGNNAGAAYVFVRSGTTWSEEAKLTAGDGLAGDRFGISVDVSGDTALVGAISGDGLVANSGSAYVFVRSGTSWSGEQELTAADGAAGDNFGRDIALDGDNALIGARADDDDGASSGSAYIFHRVGTSWTEEDKLTASNATAGAEFGVGVDIEGDRAAVGAPIANSQVGGSGAVYIFERSGTTWPEEAKFTSSDASNLDQFGFAVSVSGDTVVTGAIGEAQNGADAGAAYVHRLSNVSPMVVGFDNITVPMGLGNYDASAGDVHAPGAVFTDLTNDGYPDLYLMRAGFANELWVNVDDLNGGRDFVQVPQNGMAGDTRLAQGAVAADYDNDGDLDIYLINWRADNVLYKNMWVEDNGTAPGDPTTLFFVDVTALTDPTPLVADDQHGLGRATYDNTAMGLGNDVLHNSLTAAWADVNRDGLLDLYHGSHDGLAGNPASAEDGQLGERDTLYLNLGNDQFMDITMGPPWSVASWTPVTGFENPDGSCCDTNLANPETPREFSSTNACTFADFNNDRWPDLIVTNKSGATIERDMLYLNLGLDQNGNWAGFENVTYTLPGGNSGTVGFGTGTPADMGVVAGDLDNDGDVDAYASLGSVNPSFCDDDSVNGNNPVWINRSETGTLLFDRNQALIDGVWSWGVNFVDFDNNGYLDVHVATHSDARDHLYMQTAGRNFTELAKEAGVDQCNAQPSSFGNPHADFDRNGWVDMFVVNRESNITGTAVSSAFFENTSSALNPNNHWIAFELEGNPQLAGQLKSTRDAIGARVVVQADLNDNGIIDADETLMREVTSGSGNSATTCSLVLHFGVGLADQVQVQTFWPSGRITSGTYGVDQYVRLKEKGSKIRPGKTPTVVDTPVVGSN